MKKKFVVVLVVISLFMFMPYKIEGKQNEVNLAPVSLSCKSLTGSAQVTAVGTNNESENDDSEYGGIFIGPDRNKIRKMQLKANESGKNEVFIEARANSYYFVNKIESYIYDAKTNETCGPFVVGDSLGNIEDSEGNATLKIVIDSYDGTQDPNLVLKLVAYSKKRECEWWDLLCKGVEDKEKTFDMEVTPDTVGKLTQSTDKKELENIFNEEVAGSTAENVKEDTQDKTVSEKVERLEGLDDKDFIGTGKKNIDDIVNNSCDNDLKNLIEKYWKWVMFLTPILLIVMITIDFIKAMSLGDADSVKKSSNNAIKRVIAGILLLALPWLLEVIFGWFGLQLCF